MTNPPNHCPTKAKASLNAQQWADLARQDRIKAEHTAKRAERFARQLAGHVADCTTCQAVA